VIPSGPILFDTSILIDCFAGDRRSLPLVEGILEAGNPLILTTLVLYEWLRGPRLPEELRNQEFFLPSSSAVPFESEDARLSAELYRLVKRARGRDADIAIATCTIRREASLWTLNMKDFADIPRLRLFQPTP
jgi:predicted nucleic acid-binding protein